MPLGWGIDIWQCFDCHMVMLHGSEKIASRLGVLESNQLGAYKCVLRQITFEFVSAVCPIDK